MVSVIALKCLKLKNECRVVLLVSFPLFQEGLQALRLFLVLIYSCPRSKMLVIVRVSEDCDSASLGDGLRIRRRAKSQVDTITCIWRRSQYKDRKIISLVVSPKNMLNTNQEQPVVMEKFG